MIQLHTSVCVCGGWRWWGSGSPHQIQDLSGRCPEVSWPKISGRSRQSPKPATCSSGCSSLSRRSRVGRLACRLAGSTGRLCSSQPQGLEGNSRSGHLLPEGSLSLCLLPPRHERHRQAQSRQQLSYCPSHQGRCVARGSFSAGGLDFIPLSNCGAR